MSAPERRSSRAATAVAVLMLAVPVAYVAVVSTLVFTGDPDSATAEAGYVTSAVWLAAIVLHAARLLSPAIRDRGSSFDARLLALGLAGVLASAAVTLLNRLDVVDAATGIGGQAVIGSFAVAALLVAMLGRP